tara:strand:+ start:167 stop:460 length:294 start_codon:yes stop_codon:yes gene_type:complete
MKFIEMLSRKKFVLASVLLFFYLTLNLFEGERGVVSYYKNQKIKKELVKEKEMLVQQLAFVEKKNSLLIDSVDLDYLEILYRKKFMVGKKNEKIFIK